MARPRTSIFGRILVQIDRAFWCVHENPDVLAWLGLPTLIALLAVTFLMIGVWRTWEFPQWFNVVLASFGLPFAAMLIFTVLPLPCTVFAWKRASGETASVGECFALCWRRPGRLLSVIVRLALLFLISLLLAGIPLLWIFPRTCMTPLVAIFENQPRIFWRSRRILREDLGVHVVGGIYLAMALVLGGLVFSPRLALSTQKLGAHLVEASWRPLILKYLWIFETLSVATILTALAMSWWITLALVYHEIRSVREGEALRARIAEVGQRVLA